jgi:hypothetical protein
MARQTASVATVARATAEQATMSEQIARAVDDMRGRAREIVSTTAQQARLALGTANEVRELAGSVGQLARVHAEQSENVARVSTLLTRQAPAAPEPAARGGSGTGPA